MEKLNQITAKKLLQLKAFRVQINNPFTWGNGWQAPMYFDDRKILSYANARSFITLELSRAVAELFPDVDVVAGIAVNAIAHSVLVANQLSLPYIYVYPTPKNHGLENQIEGDLRPRQKVVVIENQVSDGTNAMRVVEALRNNGCIVQGVVAIFDYQFEVAARRFAEMDVPLVALTNYDALRTQEREDPRLSEIEKEVLNRWHANPEKWNK